jgi:hypothetical protein
VLPRRTGLKAPEEFLRLLEADAPGFWRRFAPIHFSDELRDGLSDAQQRYLRFLAGTGEYVALDTTRCLFKISALREIAPEAVLVHLYRPPESLASSHMLPTSRGWKGALRKRLNRRGFWTRRDRYNGWSFESIIGASTKTLFAHRVSEIGLDPERVYALPAVGRLLTYWRLAFERVEQDGRRYFGDRFLSQSFDSFCGDPSGAVERVYRAMGLPHPKLDFSGVHPPHGPYQPDSPEWVRYRGLLGLPGSV